MITANGRGKANPGILIISRFLGLYALKVLITNWRKCLFIGPSGGGNIRQYEERKYSAI